MSAQPAHITTVIRKQKTWSQCASLLADRTSVILPGETNLSLAGKLTKEMCPLLGKGVHE